jgi:hypothetical protein
MIDFNKQPPAVGTFQLAKEPGGGSYPLVQGSVCDSTGRLLFYANSEGLWRGLNRIPGSENLELGWYSSFDKDNTVFMLPMPGTANQYAVIHKGTLSTNVAARDPIYISVVEPLFNGGRGRIVSANNLLTNQYVSGQMRACKHGNGRDWWIIIPFVGQETSPISLTTKFGFVRFLLTASGVKGPFASVFFVPAREYRFYERWDYRGCALSPDGSRLAHLYCEDTIGVYNFNRCSGEIELERKIPVVSNKDLKMQFVFSTDSRFLYVIGSTTVHSIDLTDSVPISLPDGKRLIVRTRLMYAEWDSLDVLGHALNTPDGKICIQQFIRFNNRVAQHTIHRPNLPPGLNDMEWEAIRWPLQSFVCNEHYFPNYTLGKWSASPCDTLRFNIHNASFSHTQWKAENDEKSPSRCPELPILIHREVLLPDHHSMPLLIKNE